MAAESVKPQVIKAGHLCKACGSWIPFEFHGTYCPLRTFQGTKDE